MVTLLPLLGVWMLSVLTPGPDFVVIVQYATSRSRRHGALVAIGSCGSILLWATGSMLGLSVLLTRLSWLYEIVRLAGAAYLVYLGARTLWSSRRAARRDADAAPATDGTAPALDTRLFRAWRVGFLTNAANPKAVAFFGSLFGALLPHDLSAGMRATVIAAIVAMPLVWYLTVAALFGSAPVARLYRRVRRWIDRVTATVLILLGGRLALDR
ncbi:MAG: LysE family translocator [Mycobacteriales bacterium]